MAWLRQLFSCHAEIAGSRGRTIWRSAAESGGCRPNRNFQPRRNGIDVGEDCELQNVSAGTRIRAVNQSHNFLQWRRHESKSECIDSCAVLCSRGSMFASDAQMGIWTLNEAKSKLAARMPKNSTVVFVAAGDSIKVAIDGTDSDGKLPHITSGRVSSMAKTIPSPAIRIQIRGRTSRLMIAPWSSLSRKPERLRSPAELWCRRMARPARSQRVEPIRRAKSSKAPRCTTSSSGISPERAAYNSDALPLGSEREGIC